MLFVTAMADTIKSIVDFVNASLSFCFGITLPIFTPKQIPFSRKNVDLPTLIFGDNSFKFLPPCLCF